MAVNGILNLFKPAGITSMEVVRRVKRLTRDPKVGHGGTLDPIADGVLPIFFGHASRTMEFLIEATKVYRAVVVLGVTTDTLDGAGAVVTTGDSSGVTREQAEQALGTFRGEITQVAPAYSALKHEGQRLYNLARAGQEAPPKIRKVHVIRLELTRWDPPSLSLEVECGRGVYVRSLAHDLGQALGCGAYLKALTRERSGSFQAAEAVTLEQLEQAVNEGRWEQLLYPVDQVLQYLPAAVVLKPMAQAIGRGQQVPLAAGHRATLQHGQLCRVYSVEGEFLALVRYDRPVGLWQPVKVFTTQPATASVP
ncbi:MAG: tRNA pseudouridine(55) synthase TruB [Dehalococcoidia bacterium]|nr:tRNA pseudouridine(55) synthase TruB [Dehalococcoidia bacterium]